MREIYTIKSAILKKYISYISFLQTDEGKREFLVFPNPGTAIALHKEHSFVMAAKNFFRTIKTTGSAQILHTNRIDPVRVMDEGKKESITIVFHPLGVNHFFRQNLSDLVESNNGDHSYINISSFGFEHFADTVFSLTGKEEQLKYIETFLISKLLFKDISIIEEAIEMLKDVDHLKPIPDISKKIGTSPRNLSRLFHKHIVLSPVEFRNIVQFRYSLARKLESGSRALKDISYESNYSDASYMVRMYKKYTGLIPGTFFNKVSVESNYVFLAL